MTDQVHVEVGFDSDIGDQFPKWHDVSPYVISGQTKRGRSYEIDRIETGTAGFEFENADGRFTPGRMTLSRLVERFNAVGNTDGGTFTVDSGAWVHGGSGATDNTVAPGPDGAIAASTLAEGGYHWIEAEASNRIIPVTPGEVVTVAFKAKVSNPANLTSVGSQVTMGSAGAVQSGTVVDSNGGWITHTDTYTIPEGVTYIRPGVVAYGATGTGGTVNTLTVAYVKVTVPAPYAGKVEPGKPIRSYVVTDDNWIPFQAVRPDINDADGVRWTSLLGGVNGTSVISADPNFGGKSVFQLDGSSPSEWMAGWNQESDYIPVKAGQVVTIGALVSNSDSGGQTGPATGIYIGYSSDGVTFTDVADSASVTDIGPAWSLTAIWTVSGDGYVRFCIKSASATGGVRVRVTDAKLTLDSGDVSTVAPLSGRFHQFRGSVERWVQEYRGKTSTVSVDCVDGMALLSQGIKTKYRNAVKDWVNNNSDAWLHYWPCAENENPTSTLADLGAFVLTRWQSALPGSSSSATFTTTKTMMYADGEESGGYTVTIDSAATLPAAYPGVGLALCNSYRPALRQWQSSMDVDFWFLPGELPPAGTVYKLFEASPTYDSQYLTYITVNADGSLVFRYATDRSNFGIYTTVAGIVKVGVPIHLGMRVAVQANNNVDLYAYINGTQYGPFTDTATYFGRPEIPGFERVFFGQDAGKYGDQNYDRLNFGPPMRGTINHIVFSLNGPTGMHSALQSAGSEASESESARLHRILDAAEWHGPRRFDTGSSNLLSARWPMEANALEVLADAAESADGNVFITHSGTMVYHNRYRRVSAPVRWTVYEWADGLRFHADDSRVRNEIRAERSTGLFRIARDDASIKKYGRKSLTLKKDVASESEIADAAAWRLRRYKDSSPWCDTLRVEAHTLTADSDATLKALAYSADVSQRLMMSDLPPTAPADELDFFIEGIETSFTVAGGLLEWTTTVSVSDAANSMAWVIGDDMTGLLDTDYCVLTY